MALLLGSNFQHPSAVANKPHIFSYATARSAANDTLLEVWNGTTNAARKFAVDLDGKLYSAAATAGDMLYAVAGSVSGLKRFDSLAIGAANTVMTSSGSAPQWSTSLNLASTITAGGLITANAGLTVASGQALTLTGATVAGQPTWSSTQSMSVTGNAGTATALQTARTINGTSFDGTANITVTAAAGTLTGTTLASNVVSSSLTSVGTLTSGALGSGFTAVGVVQGGTGLTTFTAAGGIAYATAATTLAVLAIGAANRVMTSSGSAPQWSTTLTSVTLSGPTLTGSVTSGAATFNTLLVSGSSTNTVTDTNVAGAGSTFKITGAGGSGSGAVLYLIAPGANSNGQTNILMTHVETDSADKVSNIATRHYTNTEEHFRLFGCASTSTANQINIGGGNSAFNAATGITFFAAANNTTTTGTAIANISSAGFEVASGGIVAGSPTGGNKGTGTVNATAVYDDNTLLTDFVFERFYGRTPKDRPDYVWMPLGEFRAMTAREYRMPMMPSRATFEQDRALGRIVSGLWEATELHSTYLFNHEDRIMALEAENRDLRAQLAARN